jgi:hypothetical protein
MKLGILLNKDTHLEHLIGITMAAVKAKHEVIIFVMDVATSLLQDQKLIDLSNLKDVSVSFCLHSASEHGINTDSISDSIACGSQLNNAMMTNEADKVIVL